MTPAHQPPLPLRHPLGAVAFAIVLSGCATTLASQSPPAQQDSGVRASVAGTAHTSTPTTLPPTTAPPVTTTTLAATTTTTTTSTTAPSSTTSTSTSPATADRPIRQAMGRLIVWPVVQASRRAGG